MNWLLAVIGVTVAGALGTELAFRAYERFKGIKKVPPGLFMRIHPFVMTTGPSPKGVLRWKNQFSEGETVMKVRTNSEGFIAEEEFDLSLPVEKNAGEKVVLWTGGSAAWGVGATDDKNVTARRLEHHLNSRQTTHRYRVVNMAMGSWIAFQEYIALSLWGDNYDPDWLVTMDGHNDAAVPCAHAQGVGYPQYYRLMAGYINGYLSNHANPVFFRSEFENLVIRHSTAYRRLTGKQEVVCPWDIDEKDPLWGRFVVSRHPWSDVEKAAQFYLRTHRQMTRLFPDANVLFGLHPMPDETQWMFPSLYNAGNRFSAEPHETEQWLSDLLAQYADAQCGLDTWQDAKRYFFSRTAIEEDRWALKADSEKRRVLFENMSRLYPSKFDDRKAFFLDPCHLNDLGQELTAKAYADIILQADLGVGPDTSFAENLPRDVWVFVWKQSGLAGLSASSPPMAFLDAWTKAASTVNEKDTSVPNALKPELNRIMLHIERTASGKSRGSAAQDLFGLTEKFSPEALGYE